MNPAQYAEHVGVQTRTVERWLAAGELPGADKVNGRWHIPADTARQIKLNGNSHTPTPDMSADMTPTRRSDVGVSVPGVTLAEALDKLPAFLTLAQASRLLGVSPLRITENPDRFEAERVGRLGSGGRSLMVPARVVRQIAGI
jgi:hypothetical protein